MKYALVITGLLFLTCSLKAQVINTADILDTADLGDVGKVHIHGFIDTYLNYNFNTPATPVVPYFVSSSHNNELNINMAYLDFTYKSEFVRARFVPAFGTYMNSNYNNEPQTLKNILEASVGVLLNEKRKIWLDAGVLGSPITNESPVSKDQLMYSRSIGAEYAPYFVTGARLTVPLSEKVNLYGFMLNGWQQAVTYNSDKSIALQLEVRPNKYWLFNVNTYAGNEEYNPRKDFRMRYFADAYALYQSANKKFSFAADVYVGTQNIKDSFNLIHSSSWYNANMQGRYWYKPKESISARVEHYSDPTSVMVTLIVPGATSFEVSSFTAGYNRQVSGNALLRFDIRYFISSGNVFLNEQEHPKNTSLIIMGSMGVWF